MPPFNIDKSTEFGQRALRRLETERVAWLTTVSPNGVPHPRPIWFLWQDESFIIYSLPGTFKLEHIRVNPKVALNFDGDGLGGDIVVFLGEAQIDEQIPPANTIQAYNEKYEKGLERINLTPAEFAHKYSVPHRFTRSLVCKNKLT